MKAAHTVLYMKQHTHVRFISCAGHQLYEHGVDLEVEGVCYIEMHRGLATYVLGPPPSRGRDLELEEECQIVIFYFARCVRKLALYSDVIHLFDWK